MYKVSREKRTRKRIKRNRIRKERGQEIQKILTLKSVHQRQTKIHRLDVFGEWTDHIASSLLALCFLSIELFQETGQCNCRNNAYGRQCDRCKTGFWNFPNCQQCQVQTDHQFQVHTLNNSRYNNLPVIPGINFPSCQIQTTINSRYKLPSTLTKTILTFNACFLILTMFSSIIIK